MAWPPSFLAKPRANGWASVEDEPVVVEQGFKLAYPLRREENVEGLLAVDAAAAS